MVTLSTTETIISNEIKKIMGMTLVEVVDDYNDFELCNAHSDSYHIAFDGTNEQFVNALGILNVINITENYRESHGIEAHKLDLMEYDEIDHVYFACNHKIANFIKQALTDTVIDITFHGNSGYMALYDLEEGSEEIDNDVKKLIVDSLKDEEHQNNVVNIVLSRLSID